MRQRQGDPVAPTSRPQRATSREADRHAPPRPPPVMVGSQRRIELLERCPRALTLLIAPAGAGKTATLAAWARQQPDLPYWFEGQRAGDRARLLHAVQGGAAATVVVDDAHG